jgi:hypothetical protein
MDFRGATCQDQVSRGLPNLWLSTELRDQRQAVVYCRSCPLLTQCLRYTRKTDPSCGVWAARMFGSYAEAGRQ